MKVTHSMCSVRSRR